MSVEKIKELLKQGDKKAESGDYEGSLQSYRSAIDLVPDPFIEQEISTNLLVAMGDVYIMIGDYEKAQKVFADVMLCPGAPASEYIRLRRGQVAFELGDMKKAKTELACAYMNGGDEVFEDEDPKYIGLISNIVKGINT